MNHKFDSIMTEQNIVLKNVEGDTIKQIQMIDGKTRSVIYNTIMVVYFLNYL